MGHDALSPPSNKYPFFVNANMWRILFQTIGALLISIVGPFIWDYIQWRQYNDNSPKMGQVVYDKFSDSNNVLTIKQVPTNFEPYKPQDRVLESMFNGATPHVKVKVHYVALNPVDAKMLKGNFKLLNHGKRVGLEFAGTIDTCYSSIYGSRFEFADRVCGMLPMSQVGALSEYLRVPESWIAKVPHAMSLKEACTVPMACLTANLMIATALDWNWGSVVRPPLKVLVIGGNTSVGCMAIQMIRVYDPRCEIYATTRPTNIFSSDRRPSASVLDYTAGDWWDRVDPSDQFSLIVDTEGGKANWEHGKSHLHPHGEYSTCVGDDQNPFTISELIKRGVQIVTRNGEAGYTQVVCRGGDAEPLIEYLPKVWGCPGLEVPFTEEGVQDAMKEVSSLQKRGKPVIRLV